MKSFFPLANGFYLITPLLVWNVALAGRLNQPVFSADEYIPKWMFWLENLFRLAVFLLPLFMPLTLPGSKEWAARPGQFSTGWIIYSAGVLIYFAAWLPHLFSLSWRKNILVLLAPAYTPLLVFWGMSLIGSSWIYFVLSCLFGVLHVGHIAINRKFF